MTFIQFKLEKNTFFEHQESLQNSINLKDIYNIKMIESDFPNIFDSSYQDRLLINCELQVQPPQEPDQDSDINNLTHSLYFISINQLPLEDSLSRTENSASEEEHSNQLNQGQIESQAPSSNIFNSIEMVEEATSNNNEESSNNDNSQRTMAQEPTIPIKSKRRADNNNNAHKCLITLLNQALKDQGLLAELKKALKQEKTTFEKGSRYAFIIRLIDIFRIYPAQKELIFQAYTKRLSQDLNLIEGDPESELLWELKDIYREATLLFLEGKIIEATQRIYKVRNSKEKKYREKGVQKVREHLAKTGYA